MPPLPQGHFDTAHRGEWIEDRPRKSAVEPQRPKMEWRLVDGAYVAHRVVREIGPSVWWLALALLLAPILVSMCEPAVEEDYDPLGPGSAIVVGEAGGLLSQYSASTAPVPGGQP